MRTERSPCWDGKTYMAWQFDDGGREAAGFKGRAGDCVTRSIAIATGLPYREVYDALDAMGRSERTRPGRARSKARSGVRPVIFRRYLEQLGWRWHPTMTIGSGTHVHLCEEELPMGRLVVQVSKHVTCVIDRVVHDSFDPQRATIVSEPDKPDRISRRAVYGYFTEGETKR